MLDTVTSSCGPIRGLWKKSSEGHDFLSFRGIPYAQAPINELRFRPPQPVGHWDNKVLEAFRCGPDCPQYNPLLRDVIGDEDCLYLNVYSRGLQAQELLPVMVWIHGGGFAFGSASDSFYGPQRAMNQAIVLVTINYRLGPLGFMTGGDYCNIGLHDQRMALRWIKKNAAVFGGDPHNITLMGESAGAASVHYQCMAMDPSEALFHKVIMQSGSALCPWARASLPDLWQRLSKAMGDLGPASVADVANIIKAAVKINGPGPHNFFLPTPDDSVFFEAAKGGPLPIALLGINADEGAFLASDNLPLDVLLLPYLHDKSEANEVRRHYFQVAGKGNRKRLTEAISDALFVHPLHLQLHPAAVPRPHCYVYKYSHRGEASLLSFLQGSYHQHKEVSHFDEVLLQFTNKFLPSTVLNDDDEKVARFIWSTWANFAKDKGELFWPQYHADNPGHYLDIGLEPRVTNEGLFRPNDINFWDELLLRRTAARRRNRL